MKPLMMYGAKKKKKEVDPNAPPRPTLLGHEKEMKMWRQNFNQLTQDNVSLNVTVKLLQRKINRMEIQLDALTSHIKRNK